MTFTVDNLRERACVCLCACARAQVIACKHSGEQTCIWSGHLMTATLYNFIVNFISRK